MTRRIFPTGTIFRTIQDTAATLPRIEPSQVAAALGAEPASERLEDVLGPITLFALRMEVLRRLQSGKEPAALAEATPRDKLPLDEKEWTALESLATAIASPGFTPSAGQVARVLLSLSLRAVTSRDSDPSSPLTRELAAVRPLRSLSPRHTRTGRTGPRSGETTDTRQKNVDGFAVVQQPTLWSRAIMGFMLQLPDALAEGLRQQVADEQTSVEELALRLMRDARREHIAEMRWRSQNRRRLELITGQLQAPLTAEEEEEFQQLQSLAHERAAPFDRIRHQTAAEIAPITP